jgi:hypothetical protein
MRKIIMFNFIAIFLITSCNKNRLTPNGRIVTETRDVNNFTGIITDAANIVRINYGSEFKIEVKGSSNLIPYFKSYVTNKELYLKFNGAIINRDDIEVFITMPDLKQISLNGPNKVYVNGVFKPNSSMYLELNGTGKISFADNNTVDFLNVSISGSADALLEKLKCKHADISISGSGMAHIAVDDYLKASISGDGKIYYTGSPVVNSQVSGSGLVIKN